MGPGVTAALSYNWDHHDNAAIHFTLGGGGDTGSGGVNITYQSTTANNIFDLERWAGQTQVGGDLILDVDKGKVFGDGFTGNYTALGLDFLPADIPITYSGHVTYTWPILNIKDQRRESGKDD